MTRVANPPVADTTLADTTLADTTLADTTPAKIGPARVTPSVIPGSTCTPDARQRLATIYAPIREELAAVERILRTELRSDYPFVDRLVKHSVRLGGKRLRPALLLLSAQATGTVAEDHLKLAAVVEMIHTATLVHDDVLDEAQLRRHVDSVNARWGNESSVLLGDYLFTHSFYLASTLSSTFACRTIGRATNITCEGELRQVHASGNFDLAEDEYLGIIEAKTAELCACSCLLGAHYAGASAEAQQALSDYGRDLGIAFQIADDLLDVLGDEQTVGKSLGTDLEKRKATLPLIHALGRATREQRADLLTILTRDENHRCADLLPWLARFSAIDYARDKAAAYAARAAGRLAHLAPSPARDVLADMTEFVVSRQR
jgi:octaprenyl-diphosphate synthase